jgi:hypothetical protein
MKALLANNLSPSLVRFIVLATLLIVGSLSASAQGSGYDVFQTGSGASVDLSGMNLGVVNLQGVPIQGSTGNADTIMYRPQAVPSGGGTIPVNLYALFMKSVSPVNYQSHSADVYITVNATGGSIPTSTLPQPDALSGSTGTITVHPNSQGTGGTFDSTIVINADIILVTAGTSVTNSANYLGHQAAPSITLAQTGSSYSTTAPSGYPLGNVSVPLQGLAAATVGNAAVGNAASTGGGSLPTGGFYPNPIHNGSHPVAPAKNCTPFHTTTGVQPSGAIKPGISPAGTPDLLMCPAPVTLQ